MVGPVNLSKWGVVHGKNDDGPAKAFVKELLSVAPSLGFIVKQPHFYVADTDSSFNLLNKTKEVRTLTLFSVSFFIWETFLYSWQTKAPT